MPAEVLITAGPARCGKTQQLLREYRERLTDGAAATSGRGLPRCLWIAPNQAAVSHLRGQLLGGGSVAILQPNLFTFAAYAEAVVHRSTRRIRPITQLQKRRLLANVIRTANGSGALQHFREVAGTPGFVAQLDAVVAELKRADVWPEVFENWCQSRPRSDRRNRELARLYADYQRQLHAGELYDAEGRFWAAREILAATDVDRQLYDLVVISGFNDFTAAQYDILRLLSERCTSMKFSLTAELRDEPSSVGDKTQANGSQLSFAKTHETLARLRQHFPTLEVQTLSSALPQDDSLRQLQHEAFRESEPTDALARTFSGVEIVAAGSELGEIEAIATAIKSLLVEQRCQPSDIVVVHRGGDEAAQCIDAVFPDYGIPYFSDTRPRLEAEPLVRTLIALLELVREDWPFQTLLQVIGDRQLTRLDAGDDESGEFDLRPRVALEFCLRSTQLPAGRVALLEQLEYRVSQSRSDDSAVSRQRARQVAIALDELRQLDQLFATLPQSATLSQWTASLAEMLTRLGVISGGNNQLSRADRAWQLLQRGLNEIDVVDRWSQSRPLLSIDEVQELVASVARTVRVPTSHDEVGRVRILSAESARKLPMQHMFLAGLNEQAFSQIATNSTAPASESQSLAAEVAETSPESSVDSTLHGDATLLFYELITRPTESLTLSYPALDSKGQPLPPSPLLTDLQRSVGKQRIATRELSLGQSAEVKQKPLSRGGFRRQAVEQALAKPPRWLAGMISDPSFVTSGQSLLVGIDCVAQRGEREAFGPHEGLLLSDAAKDALSRRFDAEHLWSPSRLEGYAACPFRFFAEQLLHLEPLNELTLSNDPRRRGSLLHQVLATIHEELSRDAAAIDSDDLDAADLVTRFLAALDAAVKARPLRGIDQSLREIERREIAAWATGYAEQETKYRSQWDHLDEPPRPAHFEVRFGPENRQSPDETADQASTPVPFELDLGEERIRLTGQIDRVDLGRIGGVTVFNIIDYKSGQTVKLSHDKVRSGHQLQLPLYALAAEQLLLRDQQAVALATGYWNIRGKGFDTGKGGTLQAREVADRTLKVSDDWESLQPEILSRVQEIVDGIRRGDFPVYNEDEQCTRSCELSTICRIAQVRSLEKLWPVAEEADDVATAEVVDGH